MTAQQTKGTVLLVCLWHIQTKRTVPLVCKGEAGVKFSAKQKRALETAEQSQKTAIATAVSSADGAKILNSIDKLVESLEKSAKSFGKFDTTSFQEIILSSGVFRRETASGFYPWGKAHSPSAKCEAFHFAPRLFFMFLFLIPFSIRQQCIIYPQKFSTEP